MADRKNSKKGGSKDVANQVKMPWDDEPDDPSVKANEVTFTAWIKCSLKAGIRDKVSASFTFINGSGECKDNVDAGNAGTWQTGNTEGEEEENRESFDLQFEKSTNGLKCEPKFLRNFTDQTLKMTVKYPAPPPPPSTDPDEPVETPDPLQAIITLPLAPLMMLTEESDELEISDLICKQIQYDTGILSFQMGVRLDKEMLSEEIAGALNPVLISLEYAKDLPQEKHLNQTPHSVFGSISMFGKKASSQPSKMSEDGLIHFNYHRCFFVGKWRQHHLREYLQTAFMTVSINDRDGERAEGETASVFPHGESKFSLLELLNPAITTQPVNMRADLVPICRSTKERKGGTGTESLQAATLFSDEAKDLLASMTTKEREYAPGYLPGGAYVEMTVKIARPLPLPDVIMKMEEAAVSGKDSGKKKKKDEDEDGEDKKEDLRYERFGRVVLVLDYKKTTIVKKLLALITLHNTKVMNMESGPSRALATRQLTDAEKADTNLDILTGFIVMDRTSRVIVIEGLRKGALNDVVEAVGRPQKNHKKWKMLYHPDVGFSERRFVDFDLCLKQIKLRQFSLEVLMQRPDLYDRSRTEEDVAVTLECLMEMKRAERMHVLKINCSFPTAKNLLTIETQYGDFVTDLELEGGCVEDDNRTEGQRSKSSKGGRTSPTKSVGSKDTSQTPKKDKDQTATTLDKTQLPDKDEMDEDGESDDDEKTGPVKKQRIIMKAATDTKNKAFSQAMTQRLDEQPADLLAANKAKIKAASETLAVANAKTRRPIDQSFLEGMPVHIYSGQKLCTTELQKEHMRAKMKENEQKMMWTYSPEYNSGCFPMLDKSEGIEQQLRQSIEDENSYKHPEPWRYPKPRSVEDYKKPIYEISESRKWELHNVAWEENEWHPNAAHRQLKTEVLRGAFDSGSLGGGHNVIKLRRAGLEGLPGETDSGPRHAQFEEQKIEDSEPQKSSKKMEHPPMKFCSKQKSARPNLVDKYHTQIRDGEAQHHSLRFDKRRADQWLQKMEDGNMLSQGATKKYGKGPPIKTVETLPSSFQHSETYVEEPRTSEHPHQLARDCSRPVAPMCPGVLSGDKQRIYINSKRTPLTLEESQGHHFRRPMPLSAR